MGRESDSKDRASLSTTLDQRDRGDDVSLRFRYQHCYTAIVAVHALLIDAENDVLAIICENFEDILIEYPNNKFIGVQVKTREDSTTLFGASDAVTRSALRRFCELEAAFPENFLSYELVTNGRFDETVESTANLFWILDLLRDRGTVKGLPKANPVRQFVDRLAGDDLDREIVVSALLKTRLVQRDESLRSIRVDLVKALSQCPDLAGLPYAVVDYIAAQIEQHVALSSSKGLKGDISGLYVPGSDIAATLDSLTLAGKRVNCEDLRQIIHRCCEGQRNRERVQIDGLTRPTDLPRDAARLIEKAAKGGLEAARVNLLVDYLRSLQYLYMKWVGRYGATEANDRYQDLLAQVQRECAEAEVVARSSSAGEQYASAMYKDLCDRLEERLSQDSSRYHKCSEEHLIGASAALTQDCKIWWSDKFELQSSNEDAESN